MLIGDPDAAVQTFRGADPLFLADGWTRLSSRSADLATTMVLGTCYGIPQEVAAAAARVTRCIGALGGGAQRQAVPVNAGASVTVSVFRSAAQEAAYLADTFRRAHLLDGVAWRDMAVIVRGQGRADVVRRVLAAAHIPVSDGESDIPLGQEDAVRPMLQLLRAAGERAACREAAPPLQLAADPDGGWRLAPEVAVDLLTSPYGGADAVTLRRVRRGVRRAALDDDAQGASPADVLLAVALARPARLADLGPEAAGARRVARMLDAATRAISLPGARADDVLWAMWQAADVAGEWRSRALAGGRFVGQTGRTFASDCTVGTYADETGLSACKPWFDNTIFLFVADHCAASAGKSKIPVYRYHIPAIVYAPKIISPQRVDTLASQIDLAPTLLSMLGLAAEEHFVGRDILSMAPDHSSPD